VAGVVVLPFLVQHYAVFQLTMVMIYAVAVLGLNILTGYNGHPASGASS
jgi:branched-chain amino acid transport system permease protein